jgi:hypothetical protein
MIKFTPINLSGFLEEYSDTDNLWSIDTLNGIKNLPFGKQEFWGIPFKISNSNSTKKLAIINKNKKELELPLNNRADYLIFAHFCDSRSSQTSIAGQTSDYFKPFITAPGELIANYNLIFSDGTKYEVPVRRRFEINQLRTTWGQNGFSSRSHIELTSTDFHGPYPANMWGRYQTGVAVGDANLPMHPPYGPTWLKENHMPEPAWSIWCLKNPHPNKEIEILKVVSHETTTSAIGALTLSKGNLQHPLLHNRLESFMIITGEKINSVKIDLGNVANRRHYQDFDPDNWLNGTVKGWGEISSSESSNPIFDITASVDATLTINERDYPLKKVFRNGSSIIKGTEIKILTPKRKWVNGEVIDKKTSKPIPARIHIRSSDGRYFPPYGHRHEVNDNWFEDYGADLKLGDTPYAYINGKFQAELPLGEIFVEVSKGFEFSPVRKKINITPKTKKIIIDLEKSVDYREKGWVTADTHVHFLSPETAKLEAQCEDINIVNLLAAQWGDLYTNVGDITGKQSGSSDEDTIIWVGTENRQHLLGHINLLGVHGEPVFPMSTSGPTEGYFGDTTLKAMSEWADECKNKEGLVVVPHFPMPHAEVIAEVIGNKVDGLEIRDWHTPTMDTFAVHEWYRYLNCGYRVAAVGGTDKMSAGMPLGGVRTYAFIGNEEEISFETWKKAVRKGRTYTTSGPLVQFSVDGHMPGDEIKIHKSSGTLNIQADVFCHTPVHKLQIVFNGSVVAEESSIQGSSEIKLDENLKINKSGWLAARVISNHVSWHCWPVNFGAHTSPVYVVINNEEPFDFPTSQYLITVMEGGLAWLNTLSVIDSSERHKIIEEVFKSSIDQIKRKQSK